jgi:hypothetical protein
MLLYRILSLNQHWFCKICLLCNDYLFNEKLFEENHFGGSSFSAMGDLQKSPWTDVLMNIRPLGADQLFPEAR